MEDKPRSLLEKTVASGVTMTQDGVEMRHKVKSTCHKMTKMDDEQLADVYKKELEEMKQRCEVYAYGLKMYQQKLGKNAYVLDEQKGQIN